MGYKVKIEKDGKIVQQEEFDTMCMVGTSNGNDGFSATTYGFEGVNHFYKALYSIANMISVRSDGEFSPSDIIQHAMRFAIEQETLDTIFEKNLPMSFYNTVPSHLPPHYSQDQVKNIGINFFKDFYERLLKDLDHIDEDVEVKIQDDDEMVTGKLRMTNIIDGSKMEVEVTKAQEREIKKILSKLRTFKTDDSTAIVGVEKKNVEHVALLKRLFDIIDPSGEQFKALVSGKVNMKNFEVGEVH